MSRFLRRPQLPENDILALAIGECYLGDFAPTLTDLGLEVIGLSPVAQVDPRLQGHADLLLLDLGNGEFAAAEGTVLDGRIPVSVRVNITENECMLNCCLFGSSWIGSNKYNLKIDAQRQIAVKQRYARCSVCIVDESSIITADQGVAQAAQAAGLDVLVIRPGHIMLDGFEYGFIGGASFKLAPDKLAFTGSVDSHPDAKQIRSFLTAHGMQAVSLRDGPMLDIGSAVLITEKSV